MDSWQKVPPPPPHSTEQTDGQSAETVIEKDTCLERYLSPELCVIVNQYLYSLETLLFCYHTWTIRPFCLNSSETRQHERQVWKRFLYTIPTEEERRMSINIWKFKHQQACRNRGRPHK